MAASSAYQGGALVCGGQGEAGPLSTCEVSTSAGPSPAPSLPAPRTEAQMVLLGGAPVVVGGRGAKAEALWVLRDGVWSELATLSSPRWEHAVVVHEDAIWVLGGRDESGALDSVEICSAEGCVPGPTMTEPRAGLGAGLVGGDALSGQPGGEARLVVFGGLSVPDSPDALSSRTVELLRPEQAAWELGTRSGQARRSALTLSPGDGTLVVIAGENRGKLTTAVSRYSPLDKPPRLQEEPTEDAELSPEPQALPPEAPRAP